MPNSFDQDSFTAIEYVRHFQERWRLVAATVLLSGVAAAAFCLLVSKQYTAKATLLIEPPGGDPRTSTNVSPIYLESLKAYESFAGSDSLFSTAAAKFQLLEGKDPSALESLKQRVLRVTKPKDTRMLEISVTLPDPAKAQAVLQYLTQEAIALERSIARAGDRDMIEFAKGEWEAARKELERARTQADAVARSGSESALENELQSLLDLRTRAEGRRLEANADLAENAARGDRETADGARARLAVLENDVAALQKQMEAKSELLGRLRARHNRASDELRAAEDAYESARKRNEEASATARFRTEQLRVVDPGIVPQRPSFPNTPLAVLAAMFLALAACLTWLTLQFGLAQRQEQPLRTGLRVAGGGGR